MNIDGNTFEKVVLEGGGTHLLAFYLGMLREIEPVDLAFDVAGASAGAIAIALFVAGYAREISPVAQCLHAIFETISFEDILVRTHVLDYRGVMEVIRESFPRLLSLTLFDAFVITGREVVFLTSTVNAESMRTYQMSRKTHPHTTLADALYASSSIPGLLESCEIDGMTLTDGDFVRSNVFGSQELHLKLAIGGPPTTATGVPILDSVIRVLIHMYRMHRCTAIHDVTTVELCVDWMLSARGLEKPFDDGISFRRTRLAFP